MKIYATFSLIIVSLAILVFSCINPDQVIKNSDLKISQKANLDVLFGDPYDCDDEDALYCEESDTCTCNSPYSSCCDRQDLDPCEYEDMGDYSDAVACELTKVINGCTQQGWPNTCQFWGTICVKNILTPPSLTSIIAGSTPFKYCAEAYCGEFYCSLQTSLPYQHLYMSIAYQNALIAYARQIANLYKPNCGQGKTAYPGRIFFKSCDISQFGCNSNGSPSCYDKEIRLKIEYYCCSNGTE